MEIFCFLFVIVALGIGFFVWNSKRTDMAWQNAAATLHLKFQKDGFNDRTIFGQLSDLNIRISSYSNQVGGKSVIFTGYHIGLRQPLGLDLNIERQSSGSGSRAPGARQDIILGDPVFDPKVIISGSDENAVRDYLNPDRRKTLYRLFKDFDEFELDQKGIHVAKRGVQVNGNFIVNTVNLLIQSVNDLGFYTPEEESEVTPPPLPSRDKVDLNEEIELAPAILKEALFEEVEIADAKVEEAKVDAPREPEKPKKVGKLKLKPVAISAPVLAEKLVEEPEPVENPEKIDAAADEVEVDDEEPVTEPESTKSVDDDGEFALLCDEIFNSGLGRYEAGRLFDSQLKGETKAGAGTLKRVEKYYSDLVFGRGPGVALEIEILSLEAGKTAVAVVQLSLESSDLASLKGKIGEQFEFSGKLLKCDLFTNKIFVGNEQVD